MQTFLKSDTLMGSERDLEQSTAESYSSHSETATELSEDHDEEEPYPYLATIVSNDSDMLDRLTVTFSLFVEQALTNTNSPKSTSTGSSSGTIITCSPNNTGESSRAGAARNYSQSKRQAIDRGKGPSRSYEDNSRDEERDSDENRDRNLDRTLVKHDPRFTQPRAYACQYFKRDPSRHRQPQSCAGGWGELNRLK